MNDMKLAMIVSLVDKVSKPLKKVTGSTGKLNKVTQVANTLAKKATQTRLVDYYRKLTNVADRAARVQRKLGKAFSSIRNKAGQLSGHLKKLVGAGGEFASRFTQAFAVGGATVAAGVFGFKKTFLDTAATFEQYEATLKIVEGSSAKAKASMDWISNFAVKTPYELNDVTEAFVRLRAYGLDPTNGLLKTLGDTSSAMGKPMMQAVEAIADAVTGENERLKEFGIKAATSGNVITYEYTAKDGTTKFLQALKGDRQQIQKVLSNIFNEKYSGAMVAQSKTFSGLMSNLSDQWVRFQQMVMSSGVFDHIKNKLQGVLAKIDEMAANGQLQEIAERFGQSLIKTFDTLWSWAEKFASGWDKFVDKANMVAEVMGGWENTIMAIIALPLVPAITAFISAFTMLTTAILANPVGLIIAAIAAAAALIITNWDKVEAFFKGFWEFMKAWGQGIIDIVSSLSEWVSDIWNNPKKAWNDFLGWIDGFLNKLSNPFKTLMEYGSKLKSILGFDEEQKLTQKVQQVVEPAKKAAQSVALTSVVATAPAMAAASPYVAQSAPIKVEVNAPITINGGAAQAQDIGPQIERHIQAAVEKALQETMRGRNG